MVQKQTKVYLMQTTKPETRYEFDSPSVSVDSRSVKTAPSRRLQSSLQWLKYVTLELVVFLGAGLVVLLLLLFTEAINATPLSSISRVATLVLVFAISLAGLSWALSRMRSGLLQFGTRTLLAATGCVAVPLAVGAPGFTQLEARRKIVGLRGSYEARPMLPWVCEHSFLPQSLPEACATRLHEVHLGNTAATDQDLECLAKLHALEGLNLSYTLVTGTGLSQLHGLHRLKSLNLAGTALTDTELIVLHSLTKLRELNLSQCPITDAALTHVAVCRRLTALRISNTAVADAGLEPLPRLRQLKFLDLSNTQITGSGLAFVSQLRELECLALASTQVRDQSLGALIGLPNLRKIDLGQTPVGDAGLRSLGGCAQLQVLRLNNTRVTDRGLAHLKNLRQLQILDISDTDVTWQGLGQCCDFYQLRQVVFKSTALNAQEIGQLRNIVLALATSGWQFMRADTRLETNDVAAPHCRSPLRKARRCSPRLLAVSPVPWSGLHMYNPTKPTTSCNDSTR